MVCGANIYGSDAQFLTYKSTINYVTIEDCNQAGNRTKQYFDVTKLTCVSCSQDDTFQTTSSDGKPKHVPVLLSFKFTWTTYTL